MAQRETFIRQAADGGCRVRAPISRRASDGERGDVTNEDYVGALVEFSNGARGTFEVCQSHQGSEMSDGFRA